MSISSGNSRSVRSSNKYLRKMEYWAARSGDARTTFTVSKGRDGGIDGGSPVVSSTQPGPLRESGSGTGSRSQVAANAGSFWASTGAEAKFVRARNGVDLTLSDPSSISYRKPARNP